MTQKYIAKYFKIHVLRITFSEFKNCLKNKCLIFVNKFMVQKRPYSRSYCPNKFTLHLNIWNKLCMNKILLFYTAFLTITFLYVKKNVVIQLRLLFLITLTFFSLSLYIYFFYSLLILSLFILWIFLFITISFKDNSTRFIHVILACFLHQKCFINFK